MVAPEERASSLITVAKNAFFDESGTHDGSELVAMGGLVATYEAWARWEIEWRKILDSKGIEVFHYTDFMAREGEFKNNWSNTERNAFMERLCQTVSDNITVGLACAVFRSEYDSTMPQDLQEHIKHPYYFGLYTCLYMLICWPHFRTRVTLPRKLEFLFDRKKGYEGFAANIYYAVRDLLPEVNPTNPHTSAFGNMGFGAKDTDVPLQAADLLVGVVARNFLKARKKQVSFEDGMEPSLRKLGECGKLLVANSGIPEIQAFVNIFKPNFLLGGPIVAR